MLFPVQRLYCEEHPSDWLIFFLLFFSWHEKGFHPHHCPGHRLFPEDGWEAEKELSGVCSVSRVKGNFHFFESRREREKERKTERERDRERDRERRRHRKPNENRTFCWTEELLLPPPQILAPPCRYNLLENTHIDRQHPNWCVPMFSKIFAWTILFILWHETNYPVGVCPLHEFNHWCGQGTDTTHPWQSSWNSWIWEFWTCGWDVSFLGLRPPVTRWMINDPRLQISRWPGQVSHAPARVQTTCSSCAWLLGWAHPGPVNLT